MKEKMRSWAMLIKIFFSADTVKRMKGQVMDLEKIFANHN